MTKGTRGSVQLTLDRSWFYDDSNDYEKEVEDPSALLFTIIAQQFYEV